MGILDKLFRKKASNNAKPEEKATSKQPMVSTEMLMTSQYPALYLKENNSAYRDMYLQKLIVLGFKQNDAERPISKEVIVKSTVATGNVRQFAIVENPADIITKKRPKNKNRTAPNSVQCFLYLTEVNAFF